MKELEPLKFLHYHTSMPSSALIHDGNILNPALQDGVYSLQPIESLFIADGKIVAAGKPRVPHPASTMPTSVAGWIAQLSLRQLTHSSFHILELAK